MKTGNVGRTVVLAVAVLCSLSLKVSADIGSAAEDKQILSVFQSYMAKSYAHKLAEIRPLLSRRLRDGITTETLASISQPMHMTANGSSSTAPPVDVTFPILRVAKCDGKTAVVEYKRKILDREDPDMRHEYFVKEDGNWFLDSFLGTPEWAVAVENRAMRNEILNRLKEFETIEMSGNVSKMQIFMNAHFSSDALVEYGAKDLVYLPGNKGRVLSPTGIDMGPVMHVDGVEIVEVDLWRIEGLTLGAQTRKMLGGKLPGEYDKELVTSRRTGYVFIKQDGQWKYLMQHPRRPDEVLARFLDLWKDGKPEMMSRLLISDADVMMAKGDKRPWNDVKSSLPKLLSFTKADGPLKSGRDERAFTVKLTLAGTADWPSGSYEFHIKPSLRYGLPCNRISEIRYAGQRDLGQ